MPKTYQRHHPISHNQWLASLGDAPYMPPKDYRERMLRRLYPGTLREFMDKTTIPRPILNAKLDHNVKRIQQYGQETQELAQKLADENEDERGGKVRVDAEKYRQLKRRIKEKRL